MLNNQKKYIDSISNIEEILGKCNISTEKLVALKNSIKDQEILIPVVGDFSAGKSTLLNNFMGNDKKILPTGISPETSLATELRYDANERIEAIKDNEIVKTYGINDFEEIKANAANYSYLRLYLNNEQLKAISPLVLVDMPGFESPIAEHNKAINIYLERGAYFVVLVSATAGSLHSSNFGPLHFIKECDRDFSIVISKSNLVNKDDWESIADAISDQIDIELGVEKKPCFIGKDAIEGFKKIVSNLNPESLFDRIILPIFRSTVYDLKSSVSLKLSAIKNSGEENNTAIENLKSALKRIEKKEEQLIKEASSSNEIDRQVNNILNSVGQQLSNNTDNLVQTVIHNGNDALQKSITDIVEGSLLNSVQTAITTMSDNVFKSLNVELLDLNKAMQGYHFDSDFIGGFTNVIKKTMENSMNSLNKMVQARKLTKDASKIYQGVTGVLAITTSVLNPIVELAIVFLPVIINAFTDRIQKNKEEELKRNQEAEVRNQILSTVIPGVKSKVRSSIEPVLREQSQKLVEQITNEYEEILATKQEELNKAEAERQANIDAVNEKISLLEEAKKSVDELYNSLF